MTDQPAISVPSWIRVAPLVAADLRAGRAVVALESTVITHGLPRPVNLELARQMEAQVRAGGARPATVAVIEGQVCLGLEPEELERLALSSATRKLNRRDLGVARAMRQSGGTTVSATMAVANAAGIRVFATGGIGGVHRGPGGDVSADLTELSQTPVAVVCSGAKAILDLPRTLEWLETAAVPVIGWRTDELPAFFSRESGLSVSARADDASQAATILRAHWEMGSRAGALICAPCPEEDELPRSRVEAAVDQALGLAEEVGVMGKDLTPFLLARVAELTGDASLRANLALLRNNARVAAEIALALAGRGERTG
jgi:pseudouridine-5'-phosphate glycosidase